MEMMTRDKWLVLDIGAERAVSALSVLGVVDSFSKARVILDSGATPEGPWRRVCCFRALGSPLRWQRVELAGDGASAPPNARFFRLLVRREGHANFRQRVFGLQMHCPDADGEAA